MRRKAILAVTLGVLVFGFVYVWTFGFFPGKDRKRTQVLRTLVAQNVRVGDSPDLVIRFLDAQGLDHSTLMKPEYMLISGHDYAKQNVIAAIKRHVARSLMWDEALQIVFVFNEKHELTKFDVMPVYTSF